MRPAFAIIDPMFPYDPALVTALQNPARTISDVLGVLRTVDSTCADKDGLKWFNWLYLTVTQAVETRVNAGGFADAGWLAKLDVQFAGLYFSSLQAALTGAPCPDCWAAVFSLRGNAQIARIQFALAGMNAHINHDLCLAVNATCRATNTVPQHGAIHYRDYTAVNSTLETLIDQAKQTLNVRLPGDPLPAVSHLEDLIAAWDVSAAREKAWQNAESLWNLPPLLRAGLTDTIDGFTAVISKALLVPVP
jgi:hypothetical protein